MPQGLVNSPDAIDFLTSTQIESGLKIAVGDPKVDAMVGPDITAAQLVLKEAGKKVLALAQDPTRTEVQRHEAAAKLAKDVEERLDRTRVAIETRAKQMQDAALEKADHLLGPKASRGAIESELRGWVREQNKREGGLEHITKAMRESAELAGVLYSSPRFLLGLSASMHERLRFEALEIHAPELHAQVSNSVGLHKFAERIKTTVGKVRSSFYSPGLVAQASKRVQL